MIWENQIIKTESRMDSSKSGDGAENWKLLFNGYTVSVWRIVLEMSDWWWLDNNVNKLNAIDTQTWITRQTLCCVYFIIFQ